MVLEATILCIDNSEYVRNSDYLPTRLQVRDEYSSEQKAFPRTDGSLAFHFPNPTSTSSLAVAFDERERDVFSLSRPTVPSHAIGY